jgi:uncharacterized membrane protein YphA (DoxX/SURF4 family)
MRVLTLIVRTLFGLAFTVFGLNGILMLFGKDFMPQPEQAMPAAAVKFFEGMTATRYLLPLVSGTQLVAGLMILTGVWAPLGLTILAPVIVNIFLFHWFVDPAQPGMTIAWVVLALELFLAIAYGPSFRGVLDPMAKPRGGKCPGS